MEGVVLQRYKLRLGDGTVLGADLEALNTWALDDRAMVQSAATGQWQPLREFLARERAAARRAARTEAGRSTPSGPAGALPLVYPEPSPKGDRKPLPYATSTAGQENVAPSAPSVVKAAEPASLGEATPLPSPREEPATVAAAAPDPFAVPEEATEAELGAMSERPASLPELVDSGVPSGPAFVFTAPPDPDPLEVLVADVPAVETTERVPEPAWIPDDDLVPIPPALSAADEADDPPAYLAFLDPMDPGLPGEPTGVRALAEEPLHAGAAISPPPSEEELPSRPEPRHDELPLIPLKPVENEAPRAADVYDGEEVEVVAPAPPPVDLVERLARKAARGFAASGPLLTRWIDSVARRLSPSTDKPAPAPTRLYTQASGWLDQISPAGGRSLVQERSSPLASLVPPAPSKPPLDEDEQTVPVEERKKLRQAVARWAGRIVLTGALVAAGVLAVLSWRSWLPKATPGGRGALTEVYPSDLAQRQRQALREATERLPHLAGRTVEQVLATSPTGVLEPPEVFRLARDAADRGLPALTADEAGELKAIRQELLGSLPSAERRRVRDYDRARGRRAVLPSDDGDVAALVARGAEALPEERRVRLQALLAKAIVYGLVPASPPVAPSR